jgi:hypothetical protein
VQPSDSDEESKKDKKDKKVKATSSSCDDLTQKVVADVDITVAPPHKI